MKQMTAADRIVDLVGGPENIADVYHCQTRLRFSLRDGSKAKGEEIKRLDGVAGTIVSGGTFQVIIGPNVKDVFADLEKRIAGSAATPPATLGETDEPTPKKPNLLSRIIDFISSTFIPIIPALAGAGMISALLAVLVTFGWVTPESPTYTVISFMANTCFYFLPIFLAFSAAGKLGINRILAAVVAAMMVHPSWSGLVEAGAPVTLFNLLPLTLTVYSSTVIPVLLVVFAQSYVEKFLERVIPNSIKIVVVPTVVFFVMGILALAVLGPIGAVVGGYLSEFFLWLSVYAPWASPVIFGAFLPIMVMFGVHTAVGPVGFVQLGQLGYDSIVGPGALCSNIAQATAAAVVAMRTKDKKFRQIATAGSITAFMGITEPVLYGVNLPKRYPLIAAMIGGGVGGLYAGLTATRRFAAGSGGILAVPMYIGDDTLVYFVNILISLAISITVTAVVAVVLSFRFERPSAIEAADAAAGTPRMDADLEPSRETVTPGAFAGSASSSVVTTSISSPCDGNVVPLESVPDAAFSSGVLGPGLGIEPADGRIVAPCAGTVVAVMGTGHAYGIRTDDDIEVLVHVGIDTVTMKGKGFAPTVQQNDKVEIGQLLAIVDLEAIKAAELSATVVLVVIESTESDQIAPVAAGDVVAGEPVLSITR